MRIIIGWLLAATLVGSVAGRAWLEHRGKAEPGTTATERSAVPDGIQPSGLQPDGIEPDGILPGEREIPPGSNPPTEPAPADSSVIADSLPVVSEASFFGLIGFAIGYTSRKIVKVGLIFIAFLFVGVQALSYADILTVDWPKAVQVVNDLVLNLKENATFTDVLKDRIPSVGAFTAGYFLGFRKG